MAVRSSVVTVTTSPTPIASGQDNDNPGYRDVAIQNTSQVTIYLGGTDVTASDGFPLAPGAGLTLDDVQPGSRPHAVVATGTATLAVLEVGV
jgi:hypothetical protein